MFYQKIKSFFSKYHPIKVGIILFLVISTLITTGVMYQQQDIRSKAALNEAHITITPSNAIMPPNQTFKIYIDPKNIPLAFAHVNIEFDQNSIHLQSLPEVSSSFDRTIYITPISEANTTGKLSIVLAVGPGRAAVNNAAEFATLRYVPVTEDPETSTITVNTQTSKLVNEQAQLFTMTVDPATVDLNKPPTPTQGDQNPTEGVTPKPTLNPSGLIEIEPTDDTFVLPNRTEKTNGTSRSLEVDGKPVKIIYMKFDLSKIPSNVEKAILTLRIINSSTSTQTVKEVQNNSWQEDTLNNKNRPQLGKIITGTKGGKRGNDIQIDLSEYIRRKAGSVVSFAVEQSGGDGIDFRSKEASENRPKLSIRVSNIALPRVTSGDAVNEGVLRLQPQADVFVSERFPDSNNGKENQLEVDGEPVKTIYLKFDLQKLAGKNIQNAKLMLNASETSNATQIISGVTDTSWNENEITYNTKPVSGSVIAQFNGAKSDDTVSVDLTDYVKRFGGQIISIAIDNAKDSEQYGAGVEFKSREASSGQPTLIVNTAP